MTRSEAYLQGVVRSTEFSIRAQRSLGSSISLKEAEKVDEEGEKQRSCSDISGVTVKDANSHTMHGGRDGPIEQNRGMPRCQSGGFPAS